MSYQVSVEKMKSLSCMLHVCSSEEFGLQSQASFAVQLGAFAGGGIAC